ncbi:hypothetical protein JKP88DRAFT_280835 [Tribonema minus]|uniref:Ankyrin repeat protein n=1 Tax=Tribonema minus TaxID=303371 RepID=A0A835YP30_9STRA|nr:hypothetical protein JKP88DRAFT_280835 [Tribonema minus]
MSDATDNHLYGVLEEQLVRLSSLSWLTADSTSLGSTEQGPCPSKSPDKGSTFAELTLAKAELEGLRAAADALPTAQLGGRALRCGVRWLEEHMRDVEDSLRTLQQDASDHSPVSPVGRVFNDTSLRKEVLRCLGPGYWLYVAGTSKALRSAYMTVLAEHKQDHRVICATSGAAAAQSVSTFRMAQECGITNQQLGAYKFHRAVGRSGSVELIRLAAAAGMHGDRIAVLAGAAETCSIEAIEELYHQTSCSHQDLASAIEDLHEHQSDDDEDALIVTASTYSEAKDPLITGRARQDWPDWFLTGLCCRAARYGHLETLRWLMASGVALNIFSIMDAAVFSGRLEVVQRLRTQSFAFTAASANLAAALGHLPLLRWLHAQGTDVCPFDAASVVNAALWAWLRDIGALVWFTSEMRAKQLRNACKCNDGTASVQWLLSKGAVWPNNLAELVESRKWSPGAAYRAVAAGCPFGQDRTSATYMRVL